MNIHLGFEKSCPPCLGICHGNYKLFSRHSGVQWGRFRISDLKGSSSICSASFNSQRRHDNSSQNRSSYKSRGWQNQENEIIDDFEDTDFSPTSNGSAFPLSNNPSYQSTATSERRVDIVELFRKTMVQLRELHTVKKEKKVETTRQGQAEQGSFDTSADRIINVLRMHSVPDGKKSSGSENYNVNHSKKSSSLEEKHNSSFSESIENSEKSNLVREKLSSFFETESGTTADDVPDRRPVTTRLVSKFQQKSPASEIKHRSISSAKKETGNVKSVMEPVFSDDSEDEFDDESSNLFDLDDIEGKITEKSKPVTTKLVSKFQQNSPATGIKHRSISSTKKETDIVNSETEPMFSDDSEDEFDNESSNLFDLDDIEEKDIEQSNTESPDLESMKLSELRELAKTRGMKGYSKLKKVELAKLLK